MPRWYCLSKEPLRVGDHVEVFPNMIDAWPIVLSGVIDPPCALYEVEGAVLVSLPQTKNYQVGYHEHGPHGESSTEVLVDGVVPLRVIGHKEVGHFTVEIVRDQEYAYAERHRFIPR